MEFFRVRSFVIRHRVTIRDTSAVLAVILVGIYLALEIDLFESPGQTKQQMTLELDEALLLGAIVAVLLLLFSIRRYLSQKREMQRRMEAEKHIRELAFQDTLTGLANRRQFDEALKAAAAAPPAEGAAHALFLLDLNGFKQVNDVHGHGIGDELLMITAERLLEAVREGDLVARLGGDEFAVLSLHLTGSEAATNIALRMIDAMAAPIVTGSARHQVGAGVGVALIPADASTPEEAMRKADVAMYRAKEERRSALRFFEEEMDRRVSERQWLEQELRAAVMNGDIKPCFQPMVDLKTQQIVGFEAAPCWIHASHGEIGPERFLAIAEESGLIYELSSHILREAAAAASQWETQILSIDVLSSQLHDRKLTARVLDILRETGLPASRLEIEITESALVRDLDAAKEVLGALRKAGVKVALDNFGTGYSSLYHLRNFKLDKIKIDSSFIRDMLAEQQSDEIVRALVGLATGLGLTIAADGIQNSQQHASLLDTGCEQGQGGLFSGPMSAEQTLAILRETSPPAARL